MDTYDADGSDLEPVSESDEKAMLRNGPKRKRSLKPADAQAQFHSTSKPSGKWKRLQRYYNDGYNDLFRSSCETDVPDVLPDEIPPSQLGGVMWTSIEKARLFEGLQLRGRHGLPALSRFIHTKSQFEVEAYLQILQEAEMDRQRFEKQTRNISLAEVPAATEVGVNCEMKLERAADALAAFQEQYDFAMGQQGSTLSFVITHDVAKKLDSQSDEIEHLSSDDSSGGDVDLQTKGLHELFNLMTFLELSHKLFMHGTQEEPESNWCELAEQDETPAITQQAVSDFRDLVVSFLHRVIQTTIFLAQSRIKATTIHDHKPSHKVHPEDVHTALKVLNLKKDSWEYWIRLPRRFPFRVVKGTHRKGDSVKGALSYDEVEAALSLRHFSGRRRSLSVLSGTSSDADVSSDVAGSQSGGDEEGPSTSEFGEESVSDHSSSSTDEDMQDSTDSPEAEDSDRLQDHRSRVPPNKRKRQLEEELDEYVEAMDQQARQQEDSRLLSILGLEEPEVVKQEPIELGRRPRVLRKSVDEVIVWTSPYVASWEAYPSTKPAENLVDDNIDIRDEEVQQDDSEVPAVQLERVG